MIYLIIAILMSCVAQKNKEQPIEIDRERAMLIQQLREEALHEESFEDLPESGDTGEPYED